VRVHGAFIHGDETDTRAETPGLDLEGCTLPGDELRISKCLIPDRIVLRDTRLNNLNLSGSKLGAGLDADRLAVAGTVELSEVKVTGEVHLGGANLGGDLVCIEAVLDAGSDKFALCAECLAANGDVLLGESSVTGEVRLSGARIDGRLNFDGAAFNAGLGEEALNASGLEANGYVSFDGVTCIGELVLNDATLNGSLFCVDALMDAGLGKHALFADRLSLKGSVLLNRARVTGEVRLQGATLGGDLECIDSSLTGLEGGDAIYALQLRVQGGFYLRGESRVEGRVDLRGVEVGILSDEPACWPGRGNLDLDRFRYGAIIGASVPVTALERLKWLALQYPVGQDGDFRPQPYEQLAKVLREMGHREDARLVLIEKERLQRADRRRRLRKRWLFEDAYFASVWDRFLGWVMGYGYRPLGVLWPLAAVLIAGWFVFGSAEARGAFVPGNPVVQTSDAWTGCAPTAPQGQMACFLATPQGAAYPAFNAFIYSADVLLPVVDFGVATHWTPDTRTGFGWFVQVYLWWQIFVGWGLSLLAIAGLSGLVKSD